MKAKMLALVVFMLLLGLASPLKDDEGKALMAIKGSFSNSSVNMLWDWDDVHNNDFCSWRGVLCDNVSFSVVSLNLSNLNLGGEISPAVGDLLNLQSIDLQGNQLSGHIPEEIGNCDSLVYVDLSDNELVGPIPPILGNLSFTGKLYLHGNKFAGPGSMAPLPPLKAPARRLMPLGSGPMSSVPMVYACAPTTGGDTYRNRSPPKKKDKGEDGFSFSFRLPMKSVGRMILTVIALLFLFVVYQLLKLWITEILRRRITAWMDDSDSSS